MTLSLKLLFDIDNQLKFNDGKLSLRQLHMLTESLFFYAFREYEAFIRDVFILYCLEKTPNNKQKVRSYLSPLNFKHAEKLIQSNMPHLDWASPDHVIQRAELYLKDGDPIKLIYSTNLQVLRDLKRIRNHISHNSKESLSEYIKVIRSYYSTIPMKIPTPGEFLLLREKKRKNTYMLLAYFDIMNKISNELANNN